MSPHGESEGRGEGQPPGSLGADSAGSGVLVAHAGPRDTSSPTVSFVWRAPLPPRAPHHGQVRGCQVSRRRAWLVRERNACWERPGRGTYGGNKELQRALRSRGTGVQGLGRHRPRSVGSPEGQRAQAGGGKPCSPRRCDPVSQGLRRTPAPAVSSRRPWSQPRAPVLIQGPTCTMENTRFSSTGRWGRPEDCGPRSCPHFAWVVSPGL